MFGPPVVQMKCSSQNPLKIGEELYFLQLEPTYMIITASYCLKVDFQAQALFKIVSLFSVEEIKKMKENSLSKV